MHIALRLTGIPMVALALLASASIPASSANWALSFDGVDDYAAVRDLTFTYSSLTVEAWVYSFGSGNDEIVGISIDPSDVYFQLERSGESGTSAAVGSPG